jgi:hypothetical protein
MNAEWHPRRVGREAMLAMFRERPHGWHFEQTHMSRSVGQLLASHGVICRRGGERGGRNRPVTVRLTDRGRELCARWLEVAP